MSVTFPNGKSQKELELAESAGRQRGTVENPACPLSRSSGGGGGVAGLSWKPGGGH